MSRLGDAIRAARIRAKMTEKALAKKCGMTENVIKDIELGRRIVSDDQAQRILKLLGADNPVSTELEVAAEPEVKLRPKPRAYVLPVEEQAENARQAAEASSDAWLDALNGVVKRVPVMSPDGLVIDHVLTPIVNGKIEGGAPDKVLYYRCPDDMLRGFRVYAGDLLLVVPEGKPLDEQLMLIRYGETRIVRKILKLDGGRLLLQAFDHEFTSETVPMKDVLILGRCVKLERRL
jgi:transcriptional regulator with XRE-family HTH domain